MRSRRLRGAGLAWLAVLGLGWAPSAAATTIVYEATDLTDIVMGEDLWKYTYYVSAFAGAGFTVLFDYQRYTSLESPPPVVNGDWDPITFQPDPLFPDDGAYDAFALSSTPSLADPFEVSFVWLGPGLPGDQPFVVYNQSFQTIESGQTAVPDPSTGMLLAVGLIGLARCRAFVCIR